MTKYMPTRVIHLHRAGAEDICEECNHDIAVVDTVTQTVTIEIPSCFGGQRLHYMFQEFLEHYSADSNRMLWWDDDLFDELFTIVEEEV